VAVFVFLWVCYHDNSKLYPSILIKLSLYVKVVTISSRLNFGHPAPPGRGSAAGRKFLAPPYYSQRAVFASLGALFHYPRRARSAIGVDTVLTLDVCLYVCMYVSALERKRLIGMT